jgi:hypothetical protein
MDFDRLFKKSPGNSIQVNYSFITQVYFSKIFYKSWYVLFTGMQNKYLVI